MAFYITPRVTLEKLQRSKAQVKKPVNMATITHPLHKTFLYGRVAVRKLLLKEHQRLKPFTASNRFSDSDQPPHSILLPPSCYMVEMALRVSVSFYFTYAGFLALISHKQSE
ncbi:hypothetical protein XENORESO_020007 [Xenotaenia resolanae]|uniref:Uncharacterized protein n=1 Tax=Xenotaenia resolanae TaxID=208358 RepID=A0ABV0VS58_9TELE